MDEEKFQILKMIEAGQVTAEQGAELLTALETPPAEEPTEEAVEEEAWMLTAMLQVAEAVANAQNLDDLLDSVVHTTSFLAGVDRCTIFLWDKEAAAFRPAKAYGLPSELLPTFEALLFHRGDAAPSRLTSRNGGRDGAAEAPLFDELLATRAPVLLEEADQKGFFPADLSPLTHSLSALAVPLIAKGELLGAMIVGHTETAHHFSEKEIVIIGSIANQAAVGIENVRLRQESLERARLEHEMQLARQMQTSLLPDRVPQIPGLDIAADWRSAREVGGDFYDFVALKGGRLGIVIADVSGKGMSAALFMALARSLVRASVAARQRAVDGLRRANRLIAEEAKFGMFVTLFYAVIDLEERTLTYVNAGHNPPLMWDGTLSPIMLEGRGIALGVLENADLEERTVPLKKGDVVVLYTDGVIEAINDREEEFGMDRLAELVGARRSLPALALVGEINRAVSEFTGPQPQFDDWTLLVLKCDA